jgi:hypothetical protein
MAIYAAIMFIIAVLCPKDRWTHRTCEMFNVVFSIQSRNVRASQRIAASKAYQVQSTEVIGFAKGVLIRTFIGHWKEFGGINLSAFLFESVLSKESLHTYMASKAVQMKSRIQSANKLPTERFAAL